ncbi:hypothetical protein E1162_16485 [Rhodobacteraceae bacterium RKSG542]|uniref:hypothetical protein n=1 Tax=Pseudovibrio flavus TaxID=2529854 RepID=UPI0012BD2161|nr:hypothetical protein [Pseudovibrio flavus]MTI18845.1 hypothetical protein [Pseudovibrio flavus]
MDQVATPVRREPVATGAFSEAEFQLLKYQLEEKEFRRLIRLATTLSPDKWASASAFIEELAD